MVSEGSVSVESYTEVCSAALACRRGDGIVGVKAIARAGARATEMSEKHTRMVVTPPKLSYSQQQEDTRRSKDQPRIRCFKIQYLLLRDNLTGVAKDTAEETVDGGVVSCSRSSPDLESGEARLERVVGGGRTHKRPPPSSCDDSGASMLCNY